MKAASVSAAADELLVLEAPIAGWAAPLDEVPDPVFGERMLGDGLAIDPLDERLCAPCDGVVIALPASRHAVTIRAANGAEILMHLGLETVALAGEGFTAHVAEGQAVRRGDLLLSFDMDAVARRAKSLITPIVVTTGEAFEIVSRVTGREVAPGDPVMELRPLARAAVPREAAGPVAEGEVTVDLPHGLHARPAARLAAALKAFDARVELRLDGGRADLRSAVAVMALGATAGRVLTVRAEGREAVAALEAVRKTLAELARDEAAHPDPAPKPAPVAPVLAEAPPGALRGVRAAPGLAIGVLMKLHAADPVVKVEAEAPDVERRRLAEALRQVEGAVRAQAAGGDAHRRGILAAHEAFLADPELRGAAEQAIAAGRSAGVAWREAVEAQVAVLRGLADVRLAQRADDLVDLERQVLLALSGETVAAPMLPHGAIVVADELLPSQLLALEGTELGGICTARGGATSHAAILAAAMGVPALCAMGPALLETRRGVTAILDADAGLLHISPGPEALAQAQGDLARRAERRRREHEAARDPARLADGTRIEVFANLGAASEAAGAAALGAEGCGLFRTEFLYLDRTTAPTADEQQASYQAAADGLGDRPLTIRTLDAGGDKPLAFAPAPHEPNPALGLRGLRASLRQPELFRAQIAAILRVTGPGERRVLLPMVTDLADLRAARGLLAEVAQEVGVAPAKLGVMIETPASALMADQLAREADFLSVGTNDLTQYVLAMDREHPELASRLDGLHPAVLRLVEIAARAAAEAGKPISVCGGLASDPLAAPVLVGLGVGCLSAAPAATPGLKRRLRELTLEQCRAAATAALALASAEEVRATLLERLPAGDLP